MKCTPSAPARNRRIQEIRDGATVRSNLGQTAGHLLLPSGQHQITMLNPTTKTVASFIGDTLEAAIEAAQGGSR